MKRLVYNPKVDAFIKTDSGVYDVSPYIVRGDVTRRINQVSTASLVLRNPQFIWTQHKTTDENGKELIGPVFHPMDKIVIALTRLRDRPIQVFTGFLDTTPYIATYPGLVELSASCTLKRLNHTYFDAGLPFFHHFLNFHGWETNKRYGIVSHPAEAKYPIPEENKKTKTDLKDGVPIAGGQLNDSSFGQLLFDTLVEIGGWYPESVLIEKLPDGIVPLVSNLFEEFQSQGEEAKKDLDYLLEKIIGTAELSGSTSGGSSDVTGVGRGEWVKVGATEDNYSGGPVACGDRWKNRGFSYAELGVAGANAGMAKNGGFLADVFGIKGQTGLPCGFKLEIRHPKRPSKTWFITKVDNGSGQAGDKHYKIDLEPGIARAMNFSGREDVEIRRAD